MGDRRMKGLLTILCFSGVFSLQEDQSVLTNWQIMQTRNLIRIREDGKRYLISDKLDNSSTVYDRKEEGIMPISTEVPVLLSGTRSKMYVTRSDSIVRVSGMYNHIIVEGARNEILIEGELSKISVYGEGSSIKFTKESKKNIVENFVSESIILINGEENTFTSSNGRVNVFVGEESKDANVILENGEFSYINKGLNTEFHGKHLFNSIIDMNGEGGFGKLEFVQSSTIKINESNGGFNIENENNKENEIIVTGDDVEHVKIHSDLSMVRIDGSNKRIVVSGTEVDLFVNGNLNVFGLSCKESLVNVGGNENKISHITGGYSVNLKYGSENNVLKFMEGVDLWKYDDNGINNTLPILIQ